MQNSTAFFHLNRASRLVGMLNESKIIKNSLLYFSTGLIIRRLSGTGKNR